MSYNSENSRILGALGEEKVANFLKHKGCIILKRNYRDRYGEVDIIAESKQNIIFVEVKTRNKNALVSGLDAIDEKKMRLIKNEALMFTKRLNTDLEPRIDVAELTYSETPDGKYKWELKYIKSAF